MQDPKTSPGAFLSEALEAYDKKKLHEIELQKLKDENGRLAKELERLRVLVDKEKASVLDARREDILSGYDRQLRNLDASIKELGDKRKKAREAGVKTRIKTETAELYREKAEKQKELKQSTSESRLPGYSRSRLYYALFMPRGFKEWGIAALCFILVFILLPALLILLIPGSSIIKVVLIYAAIILIFGGAYVATLHRTRLRSPEGVKRGRELVSEINERDRSIKNVKRNIRKDRDDGSYDLGSYDAEINKLSEEKTEIDRKKAEALRNFEETTSKVLSDEVDEKYRSRLEKLSIEVSDKSGRTATLEKELAAEDMGLSQYVQYIGNENMDHDKLQRMLNLVKSGEAASIGEALEKLRSK